MEMNTLDMCMQVGFETEGTAIYDTMQFVKNEVSPPLTQLYAHEVCKNVL